MNQLDTLWDKLAAMLRSEIEAYGGLFSVLERQREALLSRDLEGVNDANIRLEENAASIDRLRKERFSFMADCSKQIENNEEDVLTVRKLIEHAPDGVRFMLDGIFMEVERLIETSRSYLNQNQMLIRRAYDMNKNFLTIINPDSKSGAAYRRNGVLASPGHSSLSSNYLVRA